MVLIRVSRANPRVIIPTNLIELNIYKAMKNEKPIAIIGAGLAGLTAANFLHKRKVPFVLYEAGKKIAGLAAGFRDAEGFSYDFGALFITNRLAKAIGVGDECLTVKHYGEAFFLNGKFYSSPFVLMKAPRM